MDVSARTTMKDAAKCDKRCEWQNSANQEKAERILRFQASPESMLGSERLHINVPKQVSIALASYGDVVVCQWRGRVSRQSIGALDLIASAQDFSVLRTIHLVPNSEFGVIDLLSKSFNQPICAWTQARLPAEFKHISKRRTRKWIWFR